MLFNISSVTIGIAVIICYLHAKLFQYISYERQRKSRNCGRIKQYRHYEPVYGIDLVYAMATALKNHRWLSWQKQLFAEQGVKTFEANFLGTRMIFSNESDNMKAMSTEHWKEFGVQPIRFANGVAEPFTGPGVSLTDGEMWQHSRNLIKPYFDRSGYRNLHRLQVHTDKLLDLLPRDNSTFDLQPLMQRWVSGPVDFLSPC